MISEPNSRDNMMNVLIGPEAKEVGALSERAAGLMSQLSTPTTRLPRSFHLLMPRSSVGSCDKGGRCKRAGSPVVLYNVFEDELPETGDRAASDFVRIALIDLILRQPPEANAQAARGRSQT